MMSLIQCPECSGQVSSSAQVCPHCGYPIHSYLEHEQYEQEVLRLTSKIKKVDFQCPEPRVKVCIKCGSPFWYLKNAYNVPSCKCGFPGTEIDYPQEQSFGYLGSEKWIFEECVIPMNIGNAESAEYKSHKENLYRQISNSEESRRKSGRTPIEIAAQPPDPKYFGMQADFEPVSRPYIQKESHKPNCPVCHSADLAKITTTQKAVKIAAFGIFGMGDNGKTYRCKNCGYKF